MYPHPLFIALYHHGLSASGGHYTLDVLHPNVDMTSAPTKPREGWIRIDDELVSDVHPEDVFGPAERDDRCAYLLFYRRVGGARTP
jgi:ubiquitin carboxyl-terminal hydrolase 10